MARVSPARRKSAAAASSTKSTPKTPKTRSKVLATPTKPGSRKAPPSSGKRKRSEEEGDSPKPDDKRQKQQEEKRLKTYRNHAPQSFQNKLHRVQTQRMIVVGRTRSGSGKDIREDIDVVGSTGNIYKVTIARLPECTCPDHQKGNECKHKVYALHTVLKAPEHLQYQRALLTTELNEIFARAPPIPADVADNDDKDGKRKPTDAECPICYMDLDEAENELVWCRAACGNNLHKSCFEQWAASQRGQTLRCVYCRTEWQLDTNGIESIRKAGTIGEDGYVNVAEQFGMSRARDYSSYYQPWARRQFGYGW